MGNPVFEKELKDRAHDQKLKQRGKQAPEHAKDCSFIFQFKVPLCQFGKEEPVLLYIMLPFLYEPFQLYGPPLPGQMN